ncbi:unnamed protein product, partial [Discosporangium mesarthrocarpum]
FSCFPPPPLLLPPLFSLMEFLRLLCENHFAEMQDYLRNQPDNLRSYNVVGFVLCGLRVPG